MIDALRSVAVDVAKEPQVSSQQKPFEVVKPHEVPQQESKQSVSEKDLKKAVKQINDPFKEMSIAREFVIDKDTGQVVVKILDTTKKEVIRQIPSEDALRISKNIKEMLGLLFDSKS